MDNVVAEYCMFAELLRNNLTDSLRRYPDSQNPENGWRMRTQVLPDLVVRLPGFEANDESELSSGAAQLTMPNALKKHAHLNCSKFALFAKNQVNNSFSVLKKGPFPDSNKFFGAII